MDSSRSPGSLSEALSELADLAAGLGILVLPLFPLALPVMALVLGPLVLIGLVARAILRRRAHPPADGNRTAARASVLET